MFNNNVSIPISPLTNTYINKLTRVHNEPDYSLICLATALIKPRVENFEGIQGTYKFFANPDKVIEEMAEFNNARSDMAEDRRMNVPAFYYFIINLSDGQASDIREKAKELGLTELTVVENFVFQQLNMKNYSVFINSENNSAFVVVESTQMSLYHLSISFVSLLYPALFKEKSLSKEEVEIVKGLTNKTATNFMDRVSKHLAYMKTDLMREELAECFKGFRKARIDQCKREMDDANMRVDQVLEEYRRRVEQYNDLVIRYEGLQIVNGDEQNQEERETIEYISSCSKIHNVNYTNGMLQFCIDTLLTNFDMNKWRNAVRRSCIYDNYRLEEDNVFKDKSKRKLLFDSIFSVRPLLYIKTKGFIQLWIQRCDMSAPRGQSEAENNIQLKNCLTNPHFKIHGCPGRNKEQIIRCLRQGDVVSAIECAIAATGSVNIDETEYTFRPFLQELLVSKNKVLQNGNGEDMTPEEAVLWLSKNMPKEEEIPMPF